MKKQQGNAFLGLIVLVLAIGAVVGYIWNIIKLVRMPGIEGHFGEAIIRVVGVFTGVVGAIAGYF